MRRVIDVVVALLIGLLAAPVVAVVALVVLFGLGRPVLFRQERSGLRGRSFTIAKFRSMRDARYPDEPDDIRTGKLGKALRASSLDELPQLWNILRGDMSFIGPRPTLPEQVERYTHRQRGRLEVRPGLTGWAQVNGRNSISWPERIELDLWYIENRSVGLDAKILWATATRVVRASGVTGDGGVNPPFPGLERQVVPSPRAGATMAPSKTPAPRDSDRSLLPGDRE